MRRLLPLLLGMVSRLQALLVSRRALEGHVRLGALFTLMVLGGAPACACGWWGCSDADGYRQPSRVYGYRAQPSERIPSLGSAPALPSYYYSAPSVRGLGRFPCQSPRTAGPDAHRGGALLRWFYCPRP